MIEDPESPGTREIVATSILVGLGILALISWGSWAAWSLAFS